MTDKIYPVWISDRLPSEKDSSNLNGVFVFKEKVMAWNYTRVYGDLLWASGDTSVDISRIATPEECLAREQENSNECGECGQEWEGDGDCPVCNPTDAVSKLKEKFTDLSDPKEHKEDIEQLEKIKELEKSLSLAELGWKQEEDESNKLRQALKECQIENEDLAKAWKTLKDFNDNTDNEEDEEIGELKEKLAESEERYSSLEIDTTKLKEYLNKEEEENDILWKLLKIYKFGND